MLMMVILLPVAVLLMCLLVILLVRKGPEGEEVHSDDPYHTQLAFAKDHHHHHHPTVVLTAVEDDEISSHSSEAEHSFFDLDEENTEELLVPGHISDATMDDNTDSEDVTVGYDTDGRDDEYRVLENDEDHFGEERHTGSSGKDQAKINADSREDLDEARLEDLDDVLPVDIRPTILRLLYVNILRCRSDEGVHLVEYVRMYRLLLNFLRNFGNFAAIQTKMLEKLINDLEEYTNGINRPEYQTLTGMIHFEDTSGMIGDTSPPSGTVTYTCLQRHLQFLTLAITSIIPLDPQVPLVHTFQAAYKSVLAKHHNWYVEKFYMVGMTQLPSKQQVLELLMSTQLEYLSMHTLMVSLRLVLHELNELTNMSEVILISTNALNNIPGEIAI